MTETQSNAWSPLDLKAIGKAMDNIIKPKRHILLAIAVNQKTYDRLLTMAKHNVESLLGVRVYLIPDQQENYKPFYSMEELKQYLEEKNSVSDNESTALDGGN